MSSNVKRRRVDPDADAEEQKSSGGVTKDTKRPRDDSDHGNDHSKRVRQLPKNKCPYNRDLDCYNEKVMKKWIKDFTDRVQSLPNDTFKIAADVVIFDYYELWFSTSNTDEPAQNEWLERQIKRARFTDLQLNAARVSVTFQFPSDIAAKFTSHKIARTIVAKRLLHKLFPTMPHEVQEFLSDFANDYDASFDVDESVASIFLVRRFKRREKRDVENDENMRSSPTAVHWDNRFANPYDSTRDRCENGLNGFDMQMVWSRLYQSTLVSPQDLCAHILYSNGEQSKVVECRGENHAVLYDKDHHAMSYVFLHHSKTDKLYGYFFNTGAQREHPSIETIYEFTGSRTDLGNDYMSRRECIRSVQRRGTCVSFSVVIPVMMFFFWKEYDQLGYTPNETFHIFCNKLDALATEVEQELIASMNKLLTGGDTESAVSANATNFVQLIRNFIDSSPCPRFQLKDKTDCLLTVHTWHSKFWTEVKSNIDSAKFSLEWISMEFRGSDTLDLKDKNGESGSNSFLVSMSVDDGTEWETDELYVDEYDKTSLRETSIAFHHSTYEIDLYVRIGLSRNPNASDTEGVWAATPKGELFNKTFTVSEEDSDDDSVVLESNN